MFFRRKKKQEPATSKATGSPSCCDCPHHRNPANKDGLAESDVARGIIGVQHDRKTRAQQDLIKAILGSDLNPVDYSALRDLLNLASQQREVLVVTNPDFIPSVEKLLSRQ